MTNAAEAAEAAQGGYRALFDLTGRRALVLGAGSGIGWEAAQALADFGAQVCCADRDLAAASDCADQAGPGAYPMRLDMMDEAALAQAATELSGLDILVFTPATNVRKRLLDYTTAEFDQVMQLNLRGSFSLLRAFGQGMVERRQGSIIGFTSIRATTTEPGQAVYAASKAGLVQLLRTAAVEWGPAGVRVNLIAPGVVEHAADRADQSGAGVVCGVCGQEHARPLGTAIGTGGRRGLPRLRCRQLRYRIGADGQRRLDGIRRTVHAALKGPV